MITTICIYGVIMILGGAPLILSLILGDLFDFADGIIDGIDSALEGIGIDLIPDDAVGCKSGFGTLVLLMFTTLFGCTGIVATVIFNASLLISLASSIIVGLLAAILASRFMVILYKQQASGHLIEEDFINAVGQVSSPMKSDQVGRITINVKGQTLRLSAKSIDNKILDYGVTIKIVRKEGSIAIVEKI